MRRNSLRDGRGKRRGDRWIFSRHFSGSRGMAYGWVNLCMWSRMRGIRFVLRWESFWSMCFGLTAVLICSEELGYIDLGNIFLPFYHGCGTSRNLIFVRKIHRCPTSNGISAGKSKLDLSQLCELIRIQHRISRV